VLFGENTPFIAQHGLLADAARRDETRGLPGRLYVLAPRRIPQAARA